MFNLSVAFCVQTSPFMGFRSILIICFKMSVYFGLYSCIWIHSVYGYMNITQWLGWIRLPCRFKQMYLNLFTLWAWRVYVISLGWSCPLYGLVKRYICSLSGLVNLSYYFWHDSIHFMDLLNIIFFKMSPSTLWTCDCNSTPMDEPVLL